MKSIKVKTPAKINLVLEILGKRPDGYHELQSIMQSVSLYDILTISIEGRDIQDNIFEISGNNPAIPYNETNLAVIAAKGFLKESRITGKKVSIYIEKHIPIAAGLAGGSSNAAGTLFGLNKLLGNPLKDNTLSELASQIGADVNFCLHGGTQFATGRGEKLEKLPTPDLNIVIAKPKNVSISTKVAYTNYSKLPVKPQYQNPKEMIDAIKSNNTQNIASLLHNVMEPAVFPEYPEVAELKQILIKKGCINVQMSGSGPSVFGIYSKQINFSDLCKDNEVFKVVTVNQGINFI